MIERSMRAGKRVAVEIDRAIGQDDAARNRRSQPPSSVSVGVGALTFLASR
jgi:hypothetical protein